MDGDPSPSTLYRSRQPGCRLSTLALQRWRRRSRTWSIRVALTYDPQVSAPTARHTSPAWRVEARFVFARNAPAAHAVRRAPPRARRQFCGDSLPRGRRSRPCRRRCSPCPRAKAPASARWAAAAAALNAHQLGPTSGHWRGRGMLAARAHSAGGVGRTASLWVPPPRRDGDRGVGQVGVPPASSSLSWPKSVPPRRSDRAPRRSSRPRVSAIVVVGAGEPDLHAHCNGASITTR